MNVDHGVPHWRFSIDGVSVGGFRHKGPEKVISDTGLDRKFVVVNWLFFRHI